MKVAIYQMDMKWEDKEYNWGKTRQAAKSAKGENADILFLPEMSFTGFSMNTDITKDGNFESVLCVKEIAKENNISIGFGWVKEKEDKPENHYTIVDSEGEVIFDYAKIHPFSYAEEDKYYTYGNEVSSCEIKDITMSAFICYDLRFPELFLSLSQEVSLVVVPANWASSRSEHWKCLLRARAIENQFYVIGVNCVGNRNNLDYSGDSCIINPNGDVLQMVSDKEEILYCEIDSRIVEDYRDRFPVRKDRKKELYRKLYEANV